MADNISNSTAGHEAETVNVAGMKAALQEYKNEYGCIHSLSAAPTEATLTYQRNGRTYQYKIGDEVRVPDAENAEEGTNGYVYYKLYDISGGKAYWALGGAGGAGGGATGKVRVSLEAYVNGAKTAGTDLTGLEVTLVNTTDATTIASKEWAGSTLVFTKVTPLKDYSISVQAREGYTAPAAQAIASLGIGEERDLTFRYEADEYQVSITSNQGTDDAISEAWLRATYQQDGEAVNRQVSSGTVKVPTGTVPTISATSNVAGYSKQTGVDTTGKILSVVYSTTRVRLAVTSNQGQEDDAMIAALAFTVNGTAISQNDGTSYVKVPTGEAFTVGYPGTPAHYARTVSGDGEATGTEQTVTVAYETTRVSLNMVGVSNNTEGDAPTGASGTVRYTGGSDQVLSDNTSHALVPTGTDFTVEYAAVSGYATPTTYSATASGTSMTAAKAQYVYGVLELTVSMSDASSTDLARVAPQVSINGGAATAMTGSGGTFTANMEVGDTYEITFNPLVEYGYQTPATVSGTFGGGVQTETATYQTTVYTLSTIQTTKDGSVQGTNPTGAGAEVTYTGLPSPAALSLNDTVKVPSDLTPTVTPNACYGYAASHGVSGQDITLAYATEAYRLTVGDNQDNASVAQTVVRVSAQGISADGYADYTGAQNGVEVLVPAGVTPTAAAQSGAPDGSSYTESISVDTTAKTITAAYTTCKVTVSLTSDTGGADLSGVTVTVTDTTAGAAVQKTGSVYLIPSGHGYSVSVSGDVDGYSTPAAQTGTATSVQDAAATVTMEYVYNPIMYAYVKIDQSQSGDTAMISVSDTEGGTKLTCPTTSGATHPNAAIEALRRASHLYMGKQTAAGKQLLCQLSDSNGAQYTDGTAAKFDGTEGDHWLRIGIDFYVKRISGTDGANVVTYGLAVGGQPDSSWKQIVSPNDLLAVHEAYIASSKLYSRSGVQSGADQTRDTFKTYARSRNASGTPGGKGYSCVTWEWHCVMAFLFYAWYGRTNCQAQCGTGANSYTRTLGAKNSLGMTDTTSSNGNADDVKFWGIENWWGDKYEWVDNVDVSDGKWTVKDLTGAAKRTGLQASTASSNWITKLMLSENLDLIPTANSGGSATTYFCDYYYYSSGSRVVARSHSSAGTFGGVASVDAVYGSSYTDASIGSRLAFSGEIEMAESVAAFKAASSVG